MPQAAIDATQYANYVFTVYFLCEMLIKGTGLGLKRYCSDNFNLFDALVTTVGVVEMIMSLVPGVDSLGGVMSVFRAFRWVRDERNQIVWSQPGRVESASLLPLLPPSCQPTHPLPPPFPPHRLLRIFRLARSWKGLNRIIKVLLKAVQSVAWLTVLLFLFLFIAGLLGMALFGYRLDSCPQVGGGAGRKG